MATKTIATVKEIGALNALSIAVLGENLFEAAQNFMEGTGNLNYYLEDPSKLQYLPKNIFDNIRKSDNLKGIIASAVGPEVAKEVADSAGLKSMINKLLKVVKLRWG